ncbi:MAG: hypothetical protein AAGH83_01590 [Pseudomonadota bacterium]
MAQTLHTRLAAIVMPALLVLGACAETVADAPTPTYFGTWQPYSAAVSVSGAMTVTPDMLDFADGSTYNLLPVDPGAGLFRIVGRNVPGQGALNCGSQQTAYVRFALTSPDQLVMSAYWDEGVPQVPDPADAWEAPGACIIAAYSR